MCLNVDLDFLIKIKAISCDIQLEWVFLIL